MNIVLNDGISQITPLLEEKLGNNIFEAANLSATVINDNFTINGNLTVNGTTNSNSYNLNQSVTGVEQKIYSGTGNLVIESSSSGGTNKISLDAPGMGIIDLNAQDRVWHSVNGAVKLQTNSEKTELYGDSSTFPAKLNFTDNNYITSLSMNGMPFLPEFTMDGNANASTPATFNAINFNNFEVVSDSMTIKTGTVEGVKLGYATDSYVESLGLSLRITNRGGNSGDYLMLETYQDLSLSGPITSNTSGGATGYLRLLINGTYYKIALLQD